MSYKITAQEARKLASDLSAERVQKELQYVYEEIRKAAINLKNEVRLYRSILDITLNQLHNDGFVVSSISDPDPRDQGSYITIISWK